MRLFITMLMLLSINLYSKQPEYLKDAKVTVTLKNGKTYTYDSKDMAVVPREDKKVEKLVCPEKVIVKQIFEAVDNKKITANKKNRVLLLAGRGLNGKLNVSDNGSSNRISQDRGFVGGIAFQRKLNNTFNFGLQLQDNNTTSLSIGLDF